MQGSRSKHELELTSGCSAGTHLRQQCWDSPQAAVMHGWQLRHSRKG